MNTDQVQKARRAGQQKASVGLTVRDQFAAAALTGFLAAHSSDEAQIPPPNEAASWAYQYADAMLAVRAKPGV